MKIPVIAIGNSKGIRLPKIVLKQLNIKKMVDLQVKQNLLIIQPISKKPRAHWDKAFQGMTEKKDDQLLLGDALDLDIEGWEW